MEDNNKKPLFGKLSDNLDESVSQYWDDIDAFGQSGGKVMHNPSKQDPRCELCDRNHDMTFHHLIPKTLHKNKWFKKNFTRDEMSNGLDICRDCHSTIHAFISEKELGKNYNTKEKLLEHPKVAAFVDWVSKRNGKTRYKTRRSR